MREDDAKTKWCPFARVAASAETFTPTPEFGPDTARATLHGVSINRGKSEVEWPLCVGSRCMAWRWDWRPTGDPKDDPTEGRCGLAGER